MNPHRCLVTAMRNLYDARVDNPLRGLDIVTATEIDDYYLIEEDHQPALAYHPPVELMELPDTNHTRPPNLIDRYPRGIAERNRAMGRLVGAGLRRNIPLGYTDPWSTR